MSSYRGVDHHHNKQWLSTTFHLHSQYPGECTSCTNYPPIGRLLELVSNRDLISHTSVAIKVMWRSTSQRYSNMMLARMRPVSVNWYNILECRPSCAVDLTLTNHNRGIVRFSGHLKAYLGIRRHIAESWGRADQCGSSIDFSGGIKKLRTTKSVSSYAQTVQDLLDFS